MRRVAAIAAAVALLGSCGGDDAAPPVTTAPPPATTATPSPSTAPAAVTTSQDTVPEGTEAPVVSAPPVPAAVVACATEGGPAVPALDPVDAVTIPAGATTVSDDDELDDAVDAAREDGASVIVLEAGSYGPLELRDVGPITIIGVARDAVTVRGLVLDGLRDTTIRRLTVAGNEDPDSSAVTVSGRSRGVRLTDLTIDPSHNAGVDVIDSSAGVIIEHSLITGEHVTEKLGPARNIHVGEGSPQTERWVSDIEIRGNELVGAGADGIQVAGARDVSIVGNFIHDLQQNGDHNDGIQIVAVDGAVIERNTLTSLTATSQDQSIILGHLGGGAGPAADPRMKVRDVVVTNNLVHHWRGAGITVNGTIDVTIANNTSVDNGRDGQPFPGLLIDSSHAPNEGLRVINNVVSDIVLEGGEAPAQQVGNVVEGAGAGPLDRRADPCFVDRRTYGLAPQSPAVDAGTVDGAPTIDIAGRTRSAVPDAGAVELT